MPGDYADCGGCCIQYDTLQEKKIWCAEASRVNTYFLLKDHVTFYVSRKGGLNNAQLL